MTIFNALKTRFVVSKTPVGVSKTPAVCQKPPRHVSKSVSKTVSKTQTGPEMPCNANDKPNPHTRNPESVLFLRCAMGLGNVMKRRQIRGRLDGASRGARHLQLTVTLADPTMSEKFTQNQMSESVALATRTKSVIIRRDYGLMSVEFELPEKYRESYDRSFVSGLGIGLATRKNQVEISINDSLPQTSIVGSSGSGKTVMIQSALMALMGQHTPNDARFVIIDPDCDHSDFANESHLALPIAQSDDDIIRTIHQVHKLFEHRHANNIRNDYQLFVLIDEITELMKRQPDLYDVIGSLTNGRKLKIHLIAACHQVVKDLLPGKDKFVNKFVGKLASPNDNFISTGIQGLEAHKLTGLGDFYHIAHADVTRFQVAMPSKNDFALLERTGTPYGLGFDFDPEDLDISPRFVEETTGGRPLAELEAPILADYLANPGLTVRKAQEMGYGRTTHKIHREFSDSLIRELNNKGLVICKENNCYE